MKISRSRSSTRVIHPSYFKNGHPIFFQRVFYFRFAASHVWQARTLFCCVLPQEFFKSKREIPRNALKIPFQWFSPNRLLRNQTPPVWSVPIAAIIAYMCCTYSKSVMSFDLTQCLLAKKNDWYFALRTISFSPKWIAINPWKHSWNSTVGPHLTAINTTRVLSPVGDRINRVPLYCLRWLNTVFKCLCLIHHTF